MITQTNTAPDNPPIIFPYQTQVFEQLGRIARTCANVSRSAIPIRLATAHLIIGPTGTGKTHLAKAVAAESGMPFLAISVSDWILLGSSNRGGTQTWPVLLDFIERNLGEPGVIIFIDEIDKCYHDSNWNTFLRTEIFSVCDGRVPPGLCDTDGDAVSPQRARRVADYLANKTLVLGGGAFQHLWDCPGRMIGFTGGAESSGIPDPDALASTLPRELIGRFSSRLLVLPSPDEADYHAMLDTMAPQIPEHWRTSFLRIGRREVSDAVRLRKGARFVGETLFQAMIEDRTHTPPPPERVPDAVLGASV